MNLKLLKILTIVVPAFFVGLFEWIRHSMFEESGTMVIGNLAVIVAVTVTAFFFTRYVFGVIERTQRDNLRRNQELTVLNSVAQAVCESLNLEVVLNKAIERIVQTIRADAGELIRKGMSSH